MPERLIDDDYDDKTARVDREILEENSQCRTLSVFVFGIIFFFHLLQIKGESNENLFISANCDLNLFFCVCVSTNWWHNFIRCIEKTIDMKSNEEKVNHIGTWSSALLEKIVMPRMEYDWKQAKLIKYTHQFWFADISIRHIPCVAYL